MLKARDIKSAKFTKLNEDWDDGDPLWVGTIQVTLKDGTKVTKEFDWLRAGDKMKIEEGNKETIAEFINDLED